jgi:hypothetical protein
MRAGRYSSIGWAVRCLHRNRKIRRTHNHRRDAEKEIAVKIVEAKPLPLHDYDVARKTAVSWLGDRYLLAEPVRRISEEPKAYFTEARHWHASTRRGIEARAPLRMR